jgi:hypothetical protein
VLAVLCVHGPLACTLITDVNREDIPEPETPLFPEVDAGPIPEPPVPDAGAPDAAAEDAGTPDAGEVDAGASDAGDAGGLDASADGG